MRRRLLVAPLALLALVACSSPTAPAANAPVAPATLAQGRWGAGTTCLNVTESLADLHAGCWHGQFATPRLTDGAFSVEGTFRFEAGPARDETGPPARFVGTVNGTTLTLRVERADPSVQPVTFILELGEGTCQQLCV